MGWALSFFVHTGRVIVEGGWSVGWALGGGY